MNMNRPDLSIIIVNRNTRELLDACLVAIDTTCSGLDVEVIVVDNGSTDGSVEMVSRQFPHHSLLCNDTNTGFAFPNNQGLAVSRGRHVMLLNSDTEVRPGSLARLVEFMDSNPGVGACGPRLSFPDGRLQPSCASFPTPWRHMCDMIFLDRLFPRSRCFGNQHSAFDHASTRAVDQPAGAALVVRREVVDAVGPLDERFKIHFNDADWCYRIHRAGWKVFFVHDAEVMHHLRATTRQENKRHELAAEMMRNTFDYYRKHFGRAGVAWYRAWMVVGFALRRALAGVVVRMRLNESEDDYLRYVQGSLRVALSGKPDRFAADAQ